MKPHLNKNSFWPLQPGLIFLNHGSFGSCPKPVREFQFALQQRIEHQPVQFFVRDLEPIIDQARAAVAKFVGAKASDLVFVQNATSGINTVLRSLQFKRGDELLVTDQEYNACRNALDFVAKRAGAKVVVAHIPFPIASSQQAVDAILERVTSRTRLALLDHVTSQTGIVLPLEKIIPKLNKLGVDTLIDGAHGPGMIPLNLQKLGATYYTGNCHKWMCAPKTSAFLYVQPKRQELIHPLAISHGLNSQRTDRSKFLIEFGWAGTSDATAMLSAPEAIRVMGKIMPGGWPALMQHNHGLALSARVVICEALQIPLPCPDDMIGSLAAFPLPDAKKITVPKSPLYADELQDKLRKKFNIEVPIIPWPAPPKRLLRISVQFYNHIEQYEKLADALNHLLR